MAVAVQRVQTIRHRLARHYRNELQAASAAFGGGHDHSAHGLALFDREWPQIKHWQTWSAARIDQDPDSARLGARFPPAGADLLALRQTPQERIAWLTAGRQAARAIGDPRSEAACLFLMAWALHKQAAIDEADALGREALALSQAIGDRLVPAAACICWATSPCGAATSMRPSGCTLAASTFCAPLGTRHTKWKCILA